MPEFTFEIVRKGDLSQKNTSPPSTLACRVMTGYVLRRDFSMASGSHRYARCNGFCGVKLSYRPLSKIRRLFRGVANAANAPLALTMSASRPSPCAICAGRHPRIAMECASEARFVSVSRAFRKLFN